MISYSEDQARAFVTDAGTLQRGQQLAQPAKWNNLGRTDDTAWGECAGSGSKPYLTGIDLREPAFKCSCPSRVFPCKHGAGLLLLLARQPALFAANTPPGWLEEWLAKRQQTQAKKEEKAAAPRPAVPEVATTAAVSPAGPEPASAPGGGVAPARLARMAQGADELEVWLLDLVRHGLATLDQQPAKFWESQAARLVDNQLPGLASTLRELATLRHTHADWPARLLGRLGELYWLVRAFQNHAQLPTATRQEVLQQVGITIKKEELPAYASPVADEWQVVGQLTWDEERLTARRSWLYGLGTGRYALVLEFAFGSQAFATPLVPQGIYAGGLLFYPGALPLRAAPVAFTFLGSAPLTGAQAAQQPSQLLEEYAQALGRQPWLREWPATLGQMQLAQQPGGHWVLVHPTDPVALPLRFTTDDAPWQLLARSGGQPLTLFGEWDGRAFRPLSSWPGQAAREEAAAPQPALASAEASSPVSSTASAPVAGATAGSAPENTPRQAFPPFAQLLRIALLGTRQSGEAVLPLPGLAASADSPEQQLLLAAGTLALMQKAGSQPPKATKEPPQPAPADAGQPLGPLGADAFRTLLTNSQYTAFRTDYWQQMAQHQRLVPPALLVAALQNESFRQHSPGNLALLGERGRWLAQQNPDWHAVLAPEQSADDLSVWETGTLAQRKHFIRQLRQTDAEQARQFLGAALPAEPAAAQAALLGELAPTVEAADAALLTSYLASKSKEVRQTVVLLLVRLPNSELQERLWQRAVSLLGLKRPLLGRNKLLVELPEGWDKSWQAEGIEQKTTSIEGGERAGWLGQLLSLLPPSRWTAHLGASAEELLDLAADSEWHTLLLRAWARAASLHQDKGFAVPLLLHHFAQPHLLAQQQATHLLALLSEDEKLALLRTQLPPRTSELPRFLPEFLAHVSAPWPADVVQAVLQFAAKVLVPSVAYYYGEPHQRLSALWARLASAAPIEQLAACTHTLEPLASTHPPVATLVEQFLESVRFRQQLAASLTEPFTPSLS
ncbi:hypothetical protein FNT36_04355 [Hymenobacter setariae]|uniref:SWIM-type domain-containing protein n=1 Tax=Hymenobacter setariae TaxID=2594794 RepID=A0A558C3Q8_9BACT|nr:DUF5691 domain-containing protein [Hymenobacter setariae]TVT43327.1 hypothetical protein FNT36_04355 [Hymenobacter setariae]